jgi:DNA-binding CsgD family transcriptional regulator/DNA polymerase III delta prime subunit
VTALEIVGRDEELAVVADFLAATGSLPRVLLIEGEPGIGKTTVWRQAVEEGRAAGYRVLSTRPARSEAQLAFAGLTDLLEGSFDEVLPALPPPQARALRVALLLDDPGATPADPRSVAAAVLGSLRHHARRESLLVAIDDVQWLDPSSAAALEFAFRRLTEERIAVSLALRTDEASTSQLGVDEARTVRLRLRPLTLGALHRILVSHLGLALPRPALRRVTDVSGGNPFFALELGRALRERGAQPGLHDPLPVPDTLAELLGVRLTALPAGTRDALLVAALAAEPTVPLVAHALGADGWERLRPAADQGVIALEGERVCFAHPLLASTVEAEADLDRRRRAHGVLAAVVSDPIARARHLALSHASAEHKVAEVLAEASAQAAQRGASADAAELADHAWQLTPQDDRGLVCARLLDAARKLASAGDGARAVAILTEGIEVLPPEPQRARLRSELVEIEQHMKTGIEQLRIALDEAAPDVALLAVIHEQLARWLRFAHDIPHGEASAREAVALAERSGDPALIARTLGTLSLLRYDGGHGIDDHLLTKLLDLDALADPDPFDARPSICVARQLVWGGGHEEAGPLLEGLRDELHERDEAGEAATLWYLSFVELFAGRWSLASDYSERCELFDEQSGVGLMGSTLWCRAMVTGHRGPMEVARRYANRTIEVSEQTGERPFVAEGHGVLGFLALSEGNAPKARKELVRWRELWARTGVLEPGKWVYGPDHVEACLALGDLAAAEAALEPWEERAQALDRPHVLAQAARGRALIAAADGDFSDASAQIERALAEHARVRIPFHEARTYLALGSIERRRRHRRDARTALERALAEFERLGARLWADRARDEIGRLGGRAPSRRELTPTEQRVAELVAEGLTTKEVAARLFVSPRTVDGHLAHIYAKLGVRSRADLAHRLIVQR